MKTLAEIVSSPFMCNFVHDWGKWEKTGKGLVQSKLNRAGESVPVGNIDEFMRVCHTCGRPQSMKLKRDWDSE